MEQEITDSGHVRVHEQQERDQLKKEAKEQQHAGTGGRDDAADDDADAAEEKAGGNAAGPGCMPLHWFPMPAGCMSRRAAANEGAALPPPTKA